MRPHSLVPVVLALVAGTAVAGENSFGYSYTSDTLPKGQQEASVSLTHRWDKQLGSYNANDLVLGYETGLTDRLQADIYVVGMDIRSHDAFPLSTEGEEVYPLDIDTRKVAGYKGSLKYNFLSSYKDGIGLAFVWEGAYWRYFPKVDGARTEQYSFEPKLIVQKNFLDDTLIAVYNLATEFERRSFPEDGSSESEVSITHSAGLSYRVAPSWYAGLEARHHMDVLDGVKNHNDFFLGPTLTYGSERWYLSATWLRQLSGSKAYSAYEVDPAVYPTANSRYHLEEDVLNELRVKVGVNF